MVSVIIAGGSGSRLWPLSTPEYPKHLLKIGSENSLIKNTYNRAKGISKEVYIISDISHAHHIKKQIKDIDDKHLLVEPGRKGTANCIIFALSKLLNDISHDEPIVFLSADHHIKDIEGFNHSFNTAASISKESQRIVLVGVEPDYPATGFGYIQKDGIFDEHNFVFNVDSFKEKPDFDTAQEYVSSGNYLWNCGYFVGTINAFKQALEEYSPKLNKAFNTLNDSTEENFNQNYLSLESDSIDYALIEKSKDLLVVPASFDWMDLGTFEDIHKAVEKDVNSVHISGRNIITESVDNSYIFNESDKPVIVIGVDNVAVVNTDKGLLVLRKDHSQKVKEAVNKIPKK